MLRDKREMDNFIDKLNSTLNAANLLRCDSDMDDIKDEILEDLEEEAIQAEFDIYEKRDSSVKNIKSNGDETKHTKRTSFLSGNFSDNEEEDEISNKTIRSSPRRNDLAEVTINNNMGVTNHMHNRINQLER